MIATSHLSKRIFADGRRAAKHLFSMKRKVERLPTSRNFSQIKNSCALSSRSRISGPGSKINYLLNFLRERKEQSIIVFSTRSETFLEPLAEALSKKKISTGLII